MDNDKTISERLLHLEQEIKEEMEQKEAITKGRLKAYVLRRNILMDATANSGVDEVRVPPRTTPESTALAILGDNGCQEKAMTTWTFNDLLEKAKFDLRQVYLCFVGNESCWNGESLQVSKATRSSDGFPRGSYMAAFGALPDDLEQEVALFMGISKVMGIDDIPPNTERYRLRRDERLKAYEGLLVVDWDGRLLLSKHSAHLETKRIIELRSQYSFADCVGEPALS